MTVLEDNKTIYTIIQYGDIGGSSNIGNSSGSNIRK
jgi:hypothetical protein